MGSRISPKTTTFIYSLGVISLFTILSLLKSEFSRNLIMLSVSGFLGSIVMVFMVVAIGHINEIRGNKKKPGYVPIAISAEISYFICFCVHPISFAFCFAFSIPMIIYLTHASNMKTPDYFFPMKTK